MRPEHYGGAGGRALIWVKRPARRRSAADRKCGFQGVHRMEAPTSRAETPDLAIPNDFAGLKPRGGC